ncbi:MAG: hypothetical protein RMI90_05810 [Thermoguttaceae bacterium]|nr:hypothetical protein [Thermoguttaceae bacterium]
MVFSPIAAIAPGQTQVLKVKAKAERAWQSYFPCGGTLSVGQCAFGQ